MAFSAVQRHYGPDLLRRNCTPHQVPHAHQVVGRAGKREDPIDFQRSAMPYFAQQRNGQSILVATVADGAGSAVCGGEGAAKSCGTLIGLINDHLSSGNAVDQITSETARTWIAAIQAVLDHEAKVASRERKDFACTLLGLVVGDSCAACLQIGDGVMVLADSEGQAYGHVFWPDRGEYANTKRTRHERASAAARSFPIRGRQDLEYVITRPSFDVILLR